ncbi:hypothetical protein SAMN05880590_107207 [Rhizobium sp. RU35A]|nr:hypothetical protein SAMN05880590_107207 [Rhizobium sp. RU35A]
MRYLFVFASLSAFPQPPLSTMIFLRFTRRKVKFDACMTIGARL